MSGATSTPSSPLGPALTSAEIPPTGKNLTKAAQEGNLDSVKDLIVRGANVNFSYGDPLTVAAGNGHFDVVKYLLGEGANPNGTNEPLSFRGRVVYAAAGNNHVDIIRLLLDAGASVTDKEHGVSVLFQAAENGHLEAVQRLLEAGADPNYRRGKSLLQAAKGGHLDVVKAFTAAGADVNAGGCGIVRSPVEAGHLDVVRTLIDAGATNENLSRCLSIAGQVEMVKLLLENGADPCFESTLKDASEYGNLEVIKTLLEAGSNISYDEKFGYPLHYAASQGHHDVIALLIQYGGDINRPFQTDHYQYNLTDGKGWTVMHVAARYGYPMTQQLMNLGADINCQDAKGNTPIQVAIQFEKSIVVKDMLKFCPNLTLINEEGKTALDMARDLALKEKSDTSKFQVLMTTLKEVMTEKIESTAFNAEVIYALRTEFFAMLNADATLHEQLNDTNISDDDVLKSLHHLFEERARRDMVHIIEDHKC